jgi:hypothetical protein
MYLKEIKAEMTVSRMQSAKWFVQNANRSNKKGLK